jgi:hypothetical protein
MVLVGCQKRLFDISNSGESAIPLSVTGHSRHVSACNLEEAHSICPESILVYAGVFAPV